MNDTILQSTKEQSPADSSLPSPRSGTKRGRTPLTNLSPIQREQWRAKQLVDAKRRQRLRQAALGDRKIEITVTAAEFAILEQLRERQRGPIEGFFRRALIVGAVFSANAGASRGKKVKGNSAAAAITGRIVDMSTNAQRALP